jgi:hypothetical protein
MGASLVMLALVTVSLLGASAAQAQPVEVTACGQTVGVEGGFLSGDLDCSTFEGTVITLFGRLDVNGHTITATSVSSPNGTTYSVVHCPAESSCEVVGPGILSHGEVGILVRGKRAFVSGVTVTLASDTGVAGYEGARLAIEDSVITGNRFHGVQGATSIRRSSITFNGEDNLLFGSGLFTTMNAKIEDTELSDNYGAAVRGHSVRVKLRRVTIARNGGVGLLGAGTHYTVVEALIHDNDWGIRTTDTLKLRDSVVIKNRADGAGALGKFVATRSTIEDNCTETPDDCTDILTCNPPKVKEVQCGTSRGCDTANPTWHICADD